MKQLILIIILVLVPAFVYPVLLCCCVILVVRSCSGVLSFYSPCFLLGCLVVLFFSLFRGLLGFGHELAAMEA